MRKTIVAVLLLAALAACKSQGPWPATGPEGEPLDQTYPILYLDESLTGVIEVTNQVVDRRPDGRLAVEVTFLNRQPKRLHLQIQTTFKDARGSETEKTNFIDFFLSNNASDTFKVTSLNARADRYLLQVRRMK
jgi:hypothetical protein